MTLAVRFDGHAPPAAFRSLARLVAHPADRTLLNDRARPGHVKDQVVTPPAATVSP